MCEQGCDYATTGCTCSPAAPPCPGLPAHDCCEESTKNTYSPVRTQVPTCAACAARMRLCQACYKPTPCNPQDFCKECFEALGKNLLRAAQAGLVQDVRRLLDAGADVSYTFKSEWTALHRAAAHAHADVLALLLKNGANYNAKTYCGFTALHMAAFRDYTGRCVSILLNAGAFADVWNEFKRTPLHYAAECGNEAAVRALVAAGANRCNKDDKGHTPFDIAKNSYIRRLLRRI